MFLTKTAVYKALGGALGAATVLGVQIKFKDPTVSVVAGAAFHYLKHQLEKALAGKVTR